jgi:hypothetical protein
MAHRRGLPPLPGQDDDLINVDFLLPTGMLITLTCHKMASLADIKSNVWQEARNQPLFGNMKDQGFYTFLGKSGRLRGSFPCHNTRSDSGRE